MEQLLALPRKHPIPVFLEIFDKVAVTTENSIESLRWRDLDPDHRGGEWSNHALRCADAFQDEEGMSWDSANFSQSVAMPVPRAISTRFPKTHGSQDLFFECRCELFGKCVTPSAIEIIHMHDRRIIEKRGKRFCESALSASCSTVNRDDSQIARSNSNIG